MENAPIGAAQAERPADALSAHFSELRRLLAIDKAQRRDDWQKSTAQHVGALCIDFPKQADAPTALTEISLVLLASKKGSADAKKRALKPLRWLQEPPPSLSAVMETAEEARTAVQILLPLKGGWVTEYVTDELAVNKWPAIFNDLVQWLLKSTGALDRFLRAVSASPAPSGEKSGAPVASIIQAALKTLAKTRIEAGAEFMAEMERSATAFVASARAAETPGAKKEARAVQGALLGLMVHASAFEPAILAQGGAAAALHGLHLPKERTHASADGHFNVLCARFVSLTGLMVQHAGTQTMEYHREIWSAYQACASKADQLLKNALKAVPALERLQKPGEEAADAPLTHSAATEDALCELINNWDEYAELHNTDPAVQQVSRRITAIAASLGVARFGVEGEVIPYDPLRHQLVNKATSTPSRVEVRRKGIELIRSDRSSRVLLRALVRPA